MGHERVGTLPKSKQWREIVAQMLEFGIHDEDAIEQIAAQTIKNVRARFRFICEDEGVNAAFKFLVALPVYSRSAHPYAELKKIGIDLPDNPTLFSIAKAFNQWMNDKRDSFEYGEIAQNAAIDTIVELYDRKKADQGYLFDFVDTGLDVWRNSGTGSEFCELSRNFFSKYTEKYLNYFLEREASSVIKNLEDRENVSEFPQKEGGFRNRIDVKGKHRNHPCPCGSGKKIKKCCGKPSLN